MRRLIIELYNKYIITFISITILTLYTFYISYIGFDDYSTDIYLYFIDLVLGTFIAYKIIDVYKEKLFSLDENKNKIIKIVVFLISIFTIFILHFINFNLVNTNLKDDYKYEIFKISYLLIPQFLILYLEICDKNISVPKYALMVFKNSLLHFVFTLIVFTGTFILYLIYQALIGEVDDKIFISIEATIFVFIAMVGYLVSIENTEYKDNAFLKILVYYVMQSIVFVGYIIVYAFMINIIIKMQLPPNQIYMVGIAVFFIGVLTSYMSQAFDEDYKISKLMPILFIPILIMQYIAIFVRIINYGLTPFRYTAVMVLIIETIFIIFYIFRYDKIKNILLYGIGIMLVLFYIPFMNIYSLPSNINKMFYNNTIKDNNDDIDDEVSKKSCNIYKYFNYENIDIKGYDRLDSIVINYKYSENDKKYYDLHSNRKQNDEGISDFKNTNAYISNLTSDKVIILDIDEYMKYLERLVIENDFKEDIVEKNLDNIIIDGNKKIIIGFINFRYDEDTKNFINISITGNLLTKN